MSSIIIIGAPRSGTNMLRDLICCHSELATWPCDEINLVWRHGNTRHASDALSASLATEKVQRYVESKFDWVRRRFDVQTVVEKTCANSLRVDFVEQVVHKPLYLFIYRDGLDVVASASKRWQASVDWTYTMRKLRFVPVTDIPYYAYRYLANRMSQSRSPENRLAVWGPIAPEVEAQRTGKSLIELCALQWQACVLRSLDGLEKIPSERVHKVSYEALVSGKDIEIPRIARFLGLDPSSLLGTNMYRNISRRNIGKGRSQLGAEETGRVLDIIEPTMKRLGY